jgi:1-aminocyclopropane-1-carboxylate deaminase/D-cysteine desulfhydrase-like pyridoxal-dependent ACC family enzyme
LLQLNCFLRARLGHLPAALEPTAHLSAHRGEPMLWIKRDDCTGPAAGA